MKQRETCWVGVKICGYACIENERNGILVQTARHKVKVAKQLVVTAWCVSCVVE
jgi:hypothetical protein